MVKSVMHIFSAVKSAETTLIMVAVSFGLMIMNCILGVMAKVAPQMNMFSIGIQLKILVGFLILFFMIYLFPNIVDMVFDEIKKMVVLFIEGMY